MTGMSPSTSSAIRPLRANGPTRVLYVLAIFSCLPYVLMFGTNVRFLARHMGVHGVITWVGLGTFAATVAFRAYQVLRYRAALDARPPNRLGRMLRWLGLLGMTVGATGSGGLAGIHQPAISVPGSRLENFTAS